MKQTSSAIASVNEWSCTSKDQRDKWIRAFWQDLDQNSSTRGIVRRWQKAGCDPRKVAVTIHRYVIGCSSRLDEQRKERKKRANKILKAARRSILDLETFYRGYIQVEAADRIANEARLVQETLSRVRLAFNTKRLGVSRSWTDLAMVEGFVFEATQRPPTAQELVSLIKAGRSAANQEASVWETNPENIRKGLQNFKRNNPSQAWLWTTPSRPL